MPRRLRVYVPPRPTPDAVMERLPEPRGPCPKVPLSKRDALALVNANRRGRNRWRRERRAYECRRCGAWHTTSREDYWDIEEEEGIE